GGFFRGREKIGLEGVAHRHDDSGDSLEATKFSTYAITRSYAPAMKPIAALFHRKGAPIVKNGSRDSKF
ncbi:MAG: hypothetical protein VST66_08880, partial [Nitrospirota bacterium]|nr:hypothetical protein [Nitrospirota bacterium]